MATDSSSPPPQPDKTDKKKKRKRSDPEANELEIDIALPEPPSKKALRRVKKGKSATTTIPKPSLHDDADLQESPASTTIPATKPRSAFGIWIGNLPFTLTASTLRQFLLASAALSPAQITRVHLPLGSAPLTPFQKRAMRGAAAEGEKLPETQNRGFAYVDLDSAEALFTALQVSETELGGRKVLVKDAKSFEGRPAPVKKEEEGRGEEVKEGKERSKRVFVGNLAFDVTRDDVLRHFEQAGEVEDVFLATFEDSGKCKGFGWVRFVGEDEAEKAVRGWVWKTDGGEEQEDEEEDSGADEKAEDEDEGSGGEGVVRMEAKGKDKSKKLKPAKKRKWWINKLYGRQLRCEYAEDASTRYKKRFGKGGSGGKGAERTDGGVDGGDGAAAPGERVKSKRPRGTADERLEMRRQKHRDARSIAPGKALANAPRASGGIVESKGTKTTFED